MPKLASVLLKVSMCMGPEGGECAGLSGWAPQGAFPLSITEDRWDRQKNKWRASFFGTTWGQLGSASSPWVTDLN